MDVYVTKKGQRLGPFRPFQLREKLEDGEVSPDDLGWFEGMDGWQRLKEIEALALWMPEGTARPAGEPASPPPLPSREEWERQVATVLRDSMLAEEAATRRSRAVLRFFARSVDGLLMVLLWWWLGMSAGWLEVWDIVGPVRSSAWQVGLLLIAPAAFQVPVEAACLHWLGTTPGKWMLGIRVCDASAGNLRWGAALKRSALVFATGIGFGLPFLFLVPILQGTLAWGWFQRTGQTFWDQVSRAHVVHRRVGVPGILLAIAVFAGFLGCRGWVSLEAPLPERMDPAQRQVMEEQRAEYNRQKEMIRKALGEPATTGTGGGGEPGQTR